MPAPRFRLTGGTATTTEVTYRFIGNLDAITESVRAIGDATLATASVVDRLTEALRPEPLMSQITPGVYR